MNLKKPKLFRESMGLAPFRLRYRQALIAIFGEEDVPAARFGLSSLKQLYPSIGPKLWRGKWVIPGKTIISNLFNHTPTPISEGWSVKKTQVRDFRGRSLTYNSHNGTDFAIPIGTPVVAAASGKIVAIRSEFNRGGLKVFIDHGEGLMTTSNHLARTFVEEGEIVKRGQLIALSGYSGLDAMLTFPWGLPHVHFNTWHNCQPVDPFSYDDFESKPKSRSPKKLASLWLGGDLPQAFQKGDKTEKYKPSVYDAKKTDLAIAGCKTAKVRQQLTEIKDLERRAVATIIEMNYYPTRFERHFNLYKKEYPRRPILNMPFSADQVTGLVFLDDYLRIK